MLRLIEERALAPTFPNVKVVLWYYGMQLQWRAHVFTSEMDQKCVALHHWPAKTELSGHHVNLVWRFSKNELRINN